MLDVPSQTLERKLHYTLFSLIGVLSLLAVGSLAISYRPVADDYQQIINVFELGSLQNYQEIRDILDSSAFGSLSYYVVFEILGNSDLRNWVLVIFLQFMIGTFLLYKLIAISTGSDRSRNSKLLFGIASLSIIVFSCFGVPQKSYMTFTWTASFFAHTVPELLMYILGIALMLRNPEELNKKMIVLLAVFVSHWGAIDPILSLLTIAPILIWKIAISLQQSGQPKVFGTAPRFYGIVLGVLLSGVVILVFGPSSQRRITISEFQDTNSGDLIERILGIAVLAFRENIISNTISLIMVFALGLLAGALKNKFSIKTNLSWSAIFALLFLIVFRKLVLIGAESFSYFGVWHHGTASIVLLCFVFLAALKVGEHWNSSSNILLLSFMLFLGGQVLLVSDMDLQSNLIQRAWDENREANLQNCKTKSFDSNYRFSDFLESPKTSTWQEISCNVSSNSFFGKKSSFATTPTVLFKIQLNFKQFFDGQVLRFVDNPKTKDSLERQLY